MEERKTFHRRSKAKKTGKLLSEKKNATLTAKDKNNIIVLSLIFYSSEGLLHTVRRRCL